MATYGSSSAPSQNTINYDSILGTSLFNYRKTLTDNISKSNAFWYKMQENGTYESEDGGVAIQVPLMYGIGSFDTYDGYDVLNTDPIDGITNAFFDWRQAAAPISISRKEERQNSAPNQIINLMKAKVAQAEIGIKEGFGKMLIQGALMQGGNPYDPTISTANGSLGINPIGGLIDFDPTASRTYNIGNINQNTATWWRNQTKTAVVTSSSGSADFFLEADGIYNDCSKGPGGPPDLILVDQVTYQIWRAAYFVRYRTQAVSNANYPFENFMFNRAMVVWDEFMYDVYSGTTSFTYGSAFFLNTKFFALKYDKETNFVNTPFQKPVDQDAKVAHILWMGNTSVSNRRKHGIWAKLPRSLDLTK